jgi:hypothetical protein
MAALLFREGASLACVVCQEERRGFACERCSRVCCYRCYPTLDLEPERRLLFLKLVRRRRCPNCSGRLFRQPGCLICGRAFPDGVTAFASREWAACRRCGWSYCPDCEQTLARTERPTFLIHRVKDLLDILRNEKKKRELEFPFRVTNGGTEKRWLWWDRNSTRN